MSRTDDAWNVMSSVRVKHLLDGVTDKAAIAKAIDAAYPFGERANWPYKAWLKCRREFFAAHGLPMRTSKKREPDMIDAAMSAEGV